MKIIRVSRVFHELFGEETTRLDLLAILSAAFLGTGLVLWFDFEHLRMLSIPVLMIILVLLADILGGVVANLTKGTASYYKERESLRQIFIFIHVQPILFALLIQNHVIESIFIYLYVALSATMINSIRHLPQHKAIAMLMFMFGALMLLLFGTSMSPYVLIFFIFFMMKMIVSFACSHTHYRKNL
jgi:hypothetical protein